MPVVDLPFLPQFPATYPHSQVSEQDRKNRAGGGWTGRMTALPHPPTVVEPNLQFLTPFLKVNPPSLELPQETVGQ